MLEVNCKGSPYEIGLQHGQAAAVEIKRGLQFYDALFKETTKMSWSEVCQAASQFEPLLERDWPDYLAEMNGISKGADVPFSSILVLNVRTEISFGMFDDGCTALSWKAESGSFLAQNWDWQLEQQENLICLRIQQNTKPTIEMITEAGIIGKIGLNSAGVGVCLNAIRAKGVNLERLPSHLALRAALDSTSRKAAIETLERAGVASSFHILVADNTGGSGMECSHLDIIKLPMSDKGIVTHTNHYLKRHAGVDEKIQLPDSLFRLDRINELIKTCGTTTPRPNDIGLLLQDEQNSPVAICRDQTEKSTIATLFSIVIDLTERTAEVKLGRPSHPDETLVLRPRQDLRN